MHMRTHKHRQVVVSKEETSITQQPYSPKDDTSLSDTRTDLETFRRISNGQCDQRLSSTPATSSTEQTQNVPLVFSHLEHTAQNTNERLCNCTVDRLARIEDTQIDSICTNCGLRKQRNCSTPSEQDIVESFNSLCVSNTTTGAHCSYYQPMPVSMSCRQQAAACESRYLDDTTVDELAAYFEEIVYLPRPMSEMAELMYT